MSALSRVPLFVALSLLWMIAVGVVAGVATGGAAGLTAVGPVGVSAFTLAQGIGLVGLAVGLVVQLPLPTQRALAPGPRVVEALGLGVPRARALGAAACGGMAVGLPASWFAGQLRAWLPDGLSTGVDALPELLTASQGAGRVLLVAALVIGAPVFEELVFRGFLWDVLRRAVPGPATLVLTSLLFMGYHLDPVQSPALLPTALFLGAMRWAGASVWPAVVAHVVNNGLMVLVILHPAGYASAAQEVPLGLAMVGGLLSAGCVGVAGRPRGRLTGEDGA